jgi:6,7-dimethyl-8-ribityllumazine synthase
LTLVRGETEHFDVVCPVPNAQYYQITLSEELGR